MLLLQCETDKEYVVLSDNGLVVERGNYENDQELMERLSEKYEFIEKI